MKRFHAWVLLGCFQLSHAAPLVFCDISKGLELINQKAYSRIQVEKILADCDTVSAKDPSVLLLHGLYERSKSKEHKRYQVAIDWLLKAHQAVPDNKSIMLELAATYQMAGEPLQAAPIYTMLLSGNPKNRAALLGQAALFSKQLQWQKAEAIYMTLLKNQPKDVDALNGLGWIKAGEKNLLASAQYFQDTLKLQPENPEALLGLKKIKETQEQIASANAKTVLDAAKRVAVIQPVRAPLPQPLSAAERGLILLNQKHPPLMLIQALMISADRHTPNAMATLMLHGLFARYFKDYPRAIMWFSRAVQRAKPKDYTPALELAITYEWSGMPKKALFIYQQILFEKPGDRAALLGTGRTLRALYKMPQSKMVYRYMLNKSPYDVEVLNGYGETLLANYEFKEARAVFNDTLNVSPKNKQTRTNLQLLDNATKNILGLSGSHYAVPPKTSEGMNLFYFKNLNATDGFTLLATHNTRQIESGFGFGPTLLPNNSVLLGYQRIIPKKYSWQVSYDARQHNALPFEHRAFGLGGLFLAPNLEWFSGMRLIVPKPWNTQLYISGLTMYTPYPANITLTGFWSEQQIGGYSSSYVLDFSKEFSNSFFYDLGTSYLPQQQKSWEVHGKLIVPIFKHQALTGDVSHYFFNNSSFITAGWRFYW